MFLFLLCDTFCKILIASDIAMWRSWLFLDNLNSVNPSLDGLDSSNGVSVLATAFCFG